MIILKPLKLLVTIFVWLADSPYLFLPTKIINVEMFIQLKYQSSFFKHIAPNLPSRTDHWCFSKVSWREIPHELMPWLDLSAELAIKLTLNS